MTSPPSPAPPERTSIVLYLVSPASGELVELLARLVVSQLENVKHKRRIFPMVRTTEDLADVLHGISARPGFVLHSLLEPAMRETLERGCKRLGVPCLFVLEPFMSSIAEHFGVRAGPGVSPRAVVDDAFARRLEAMRYALGHDDSIGLAELEKADVVLLGASRVTKTPTCMYLAHRGIKAANVALVPGAPLPDPLVQAQRPLKVGLTMSPVELARIRSERVQAFAMGEGSAYGDVDAVREELTEIRRLIVRHGWPMIDVTRRSIDQVAAIILDLLEKRRARMVDAPAVADFD